jgi:hypothetical protein
MGGGVGIIGGMGYNLVMGRRKVIVQPVFNDNFNYWNIRFG